MTTYVVTIAVGNDGYERPPTEAIRRQAKGQMTFFDQMSDQAPTQDQTEG